MQLLLFAIYNFLFFTNNLNEENNQQKKFQDDCTFYINMARNNPKLFFNNYVKPFADSADLENSSYYQSLKKEMLTMKPLSIVSFDNLLADVCSLHVSDLGPKGIMSHTNSKGLSFGKRTEHVLAKGESGCECIQYGFENAKDVICDLLIDKGIADLGHRKCILSNGKLFFGAYKGFHKKYKVHTVLILKGT